MIKDVFVLKRNAWHMKLMKYIWNFTEHDFSHMCPYFWLSILNILIVPFVFFFRCLIYILVYIVKAIDKVFESFSNYFHQRYKARSKMILEDSESIQNYLNRLAEKKMKAKAFNDVERYVYDSIMFRDRFSDYYDRYREILHAKHIEASRKAKEVKTLLVVKKAKNVEKVTTNKEMISKIVVFFQPILKILMYLLGALVVTGVLYLFFKFFMFLKSVESATWIIIGTGILIVIGIGLAIGLMLLIIALLSTININTKRFQKPFGIMFKPFSKFFKGVGSLFSIIVQMVKNNCPALKFED